MNEAQKHEEVGGVPAVANDRHRWVSGLKQLSQVQSPAVNLVLLKRSLSRPLATWARRVARSATFNHMLAVGPGLSLRTQLLTIVPQGAGREAFADDLARLARVFRGLTSSGWARLKIECVSTDACKKFHVDNVTIRMICTYTGPGTQFIAEHALNRAHMVPGMMSPPLQPGGTIEQLAAGDLGIMKGVRSAANARWGCVHRSPPIEAEGLRRLVVTLDEMAPPS